ncbi:MAG: hypothetical protein Sapg2KO_29830 [Saprospiraceae bacterium]
MLLTSPFVKAQNVESFVLDSASIHVTPRPTPVNGQYEPSDYSTINKPLVAESFSDNLMLGIDPTSIHPNATGFSTALFGGDTPIPDNSGLIATPIYTTKTYELSDFPITMRCNFFNSQDVGLYNESYFFLVPADYTSFGSPTFNLASQDLVKEGIVMGARPSESRVSNNQGNQEPTVRIADNTHNAARNGEWYLASVTLDVDGNNLIVQEFTTNGTPVLQNIIVGPLDWLDDFRLGIAVDDLASNFTIETQEEEFSVDFEVSDSLLCAGDCISIQNLTSFSGGDPVSYNWTFTGADQSSSIDSVITQLCYNEGGTFNIELSATVGGQTLSTNKNITVLPLVEIDLGADNIELCNGTSFTLDAFSPAADNYFWQDGSNLPTLEIDTTGLYIVQATNPCNNVLDSVFATFSAPLLPPDFPTLYSLCEVDSITLDFTSQNALSYSWSDGSINPIRTFNMEGNYQLQIVNECEELILDLTFEKDNCCNFYAPNAFSPNLDGQNDVFQIFFNSDACDLIGDFELQVFDRWGGKVFETTEHNFKWDGRKQGQLVQPGVYAWRMTYTNNGTPQQAYGEILLVN